MRKRGVKEIVAEMSWHSDMRIFAWISRIWLLCMRVFIYYNKGCVDGGCGLVCSPPRRDSIRSIMFMAPTHISGSSLVNGLLVGTNQGSVLGFTIDIPQGKSREARVPVIMPVGELTLEGMPLYALFEKAETLFIEILCFLITIIMEWNFAFALFMHSIWCKCGHF